MTYKEKQLNMIYEKYFKQRDDFSHACLIADEICEKVYKEHGACYSSHCKEKMRKSWLKDVITDYEDMDLFWYLASQRHHEKEKQKKIAEMTTKDYVRVKDIQDFSTWQKAEMYTQSGSILGETTVQGRIQEHDGKYWLIPKGKRSRGYILSRIDIQDYFIKPITQYSK